MKQKNLLFQRWSIYFQALMIYIWLTNLSQLTTTDTYYSVYLLCGAGSILCLAKNYRSKPYLSRQEMLVLGSFAALFSTAVTGANYALFEPLTVLQNLFNCLCCLTGGFFVGFQTLYWMYSREEAARQERKSSQWLGLLVFGSIACINLLYLYGVQFPGVLTRDSMSTMRQIMGAEPYHNTMPFYHTMLVKCFVDLGLKLFGEINQAVALYHSAQILFMAACAAYSVSTLYQAGVPKGIVGGVYLLYAIAPYNIVYSVTLWKDVPFAGATLLMSTAFFRILRGIGREDSNRLCFALGAFGLCVLRTNGWYAAAVTLAILLLCMRREKKLLAVLAGVVAVSWILISPVLTVLNIEQTNYMEALAVPYQQVARVVAYDRELEEADRELLEKAVDLERVRQVYDPLTVDPIKFEAISGEGADFIRTHWEDYLRLYLRLGLKYPADYGKAWVDETKGYWNGGYAFWIYTKGVDENQLGLEAKPGTGILSRCFGAAFRYLEKPEMLQPVYSIGLYIWAIVSSCVVCALRKRREVLLALPLLVLTVGLWLGTPVYAEFRYAYPMILSAPIVVCGAMFPQKE